MLTCIYVVEKIDGDYAELRRVDALKHDPEETKTVARALLPGDIMEGTGCQRSELYCSFRQ